MSEQSPQLLAPEIPQIEHDFLHLDTMDRARLERYFNYLQQRISDPVRYMDRGGAGSVFNVNDSVCIKMIEDRQALEERRAREEGRTPFALDLGNRPVVEARIQEHVHDLVVADTRAPHLVQYLPGETWHGLIMERLDAVNLQHVLGGTALLPEAFNKDKFLRSLGDYLEVLHERKQIYHGDLEPRNVMIHNETGDPRMIDFGRSGKLFGNPRDEHAALDWKKYDAIDEKVMAL